MNTLEIKKIATILKDFRNCEKETLSDNELADAITCLSQLECFIEGFRDVFGTSAIYWVMMNLYEYIGFARARGWTEEKIKALRERT